jgi:carbonic anhydrase
VTAPSGEFADVLAANRAYAAEFALGGLAAPAARGLAMLTCIDSRIEPLAMLGIAPGDAKIIRNAGARVTDDALRSLVLAVNLLAVRRVAVVAHTDCAMAKATDAELAAQIADLRGADTTGWEFHAIDDQHATLRTDVARIRACPLLPVDLIVGAFVYDVETGLLEVVDPG